MQEPAQAPPPPPTPPALPNAQTLREQIREQVEAARALAQDAGAAAGAGAGAAPTAPPAPGDLTPTVVVRDMPFEMIPPQVVDITLMFFLTIFAIIVGFPIARALARWIDRRGQTTKLPADVTTQLNQIAQSVDAMAIEIERISEGQRFTTKLLADQHDTRRSLAQGGDAAAR